MKLAGSCFLQYLNPRDINTKKRFCITSQHDNHVLHSHPGEYNGDSLQVRLVSIYSGLGRRR